MTQCLPLSTLFVMLAAAGCAKVVADARIDPASAANLRAARANGVAPVLPMSKNSLTLTVWPRVVREQADVLVRARVGRDPRSRTLLIEWWRDDGVGGSHQIPLDGERSAITHEYPIKRLEPGEYKVAAVLDLSDGRRLRRELKVLVIGLGHPFDDRIDQ